MKSIKTIFAVVLFFCFYSVHAQSLSLSVSAKSIGSQDQIQVTYSLKNTNSDQNISPDFLDWQVVNSNTSQQTTIINNQTSSSLDYSFVLMPKRTGTLTIPGMRLNINGKSISCNPVTISVSKQAHLNSNNNSTGNQSNGNSIMQQQMQQMQQLQQQMNAMFNDDDNGGNPFANTNAGIVLHSGESLSEAAKGKIFIVAKPSKTTFYIGEPITVSYELYSAVNFNPQPVRIPTFSGFSVTDLTQNMNSYAKRYDGKNYTIIPLRKAQLVALKNGNLSLDSAVVNCQIYYTDAATNTMRVGTATIKNKPVTVHILPLPTQNKPQDFSGAIGDFTITATVDKNSLPAQENNNLHIQISGTGSLDNVTLPAINYSSNIQAFDSKDSQTIDKSTLPMPVTKSYDIPFIGNDKGFGIIPSIKFSYFNTAKNDYETTSTDSIKIAFGAAIAPKDNPQNPIISDTGNKKYLWIVAGLAAILVSYFLIKERKNKKLKIQKKAEPVKENNITEKVEEKPETIATTEVQPEENSETVLINKKEKLNESLNELINETDNHQFFILAKALLIQYLQDKLNCVSCEENELINKLKIKDSQEADVISNLFSRCNKALYMPAISAFERDEVLSRIKYLIYNF